MKKMIVVGIVFVLTVGLTGCSWFQSAEPVEEVTTVTGKFVRTAMGANYFSSDDYEMAINFSNAEKVDLLWKEFDASVDCADYHVDATLKVKDIKEAEGAYDKYLSAELVEVINKSDVICDKVQ